MKEIATRTLSGAAYVVLLLGATYHSAQAFLIVFYVFGLVVLFEFLRLIRLNTWILYLLYTLIIGLFSLAVFPDYITINLLLLTLTTQIFLIKDLYTKSQRKYQLIKKYVVSIFYLINAFVFLVLLPKYNGVYQPHLISGIFFLTWTNDSFAFLMGKTIGKHKLLERVSPKKTVEGFVGGLIFGMLASCMVYHFTQTLSPLTWLFISLIISIFGPLGDLIQSNFKREAGVKDSGSIMPGHGGIYDRLDSMLFAAPFLYAFLYLIHYVS